MGYHASTMQWLRGKTLFQQVALVLMLLAVGAAIVSFYFGGTSDAGLVLLALILCYAAFRKELLWSVLNRLLVTSFLLAVVPIFLIGLALTLTTELLLGQFAAQRIQQALEARIQSVRDTTQNLWLAASHGAKEDLLDGIRQGVPKLLAVVQVNGGALRLPQDGRFETSPPWIAPGSGSPRANASGSQSSIERYGLKWSQCILMRRDIFTHRLGNVHATRRASTDGCAFLQFRDQCLIHFV